MREDKMGGNILKKNIFLTGRASAGKTAVIKKVIEKLNVPAKGFYIEQERETSTKVGFAMITLDGKRCYLAHHTIASPCMIRGYGVSIENVETVAVPSIFPAGTDVIILDGIGKMECFSDAFKRAVIRALDSSNIVIGTISQGKDDFIMKIKNRRDVEIHEVTRNNRKLLPEFLLGRIAGLLNAYGKKIPFAHK